MAVMAAKPPGCAQRSVVAGERGLRGRNGAMEAPPEAPPRSGCAALAEEANQLRDVGDGGEAARRVRGKVPGRIKLVLAPQLTVVLIRLN